MTENNSPTSRVGLPLVTRGRAINKGLEAIRNHLGMQVAYVSEFSAEQSIFRAVDAPGFEGVIKPGDSQPLDDIFCRHILAGRLPEVMPDVSQEPLAMSMPIMQKVPIGSHISVPIRLPDGETYGMFCCLSLKPDPSLNDRDLQVMRVFAEMAAEEIAEERKLKRTKDDMAARVRDVLVREAFHPVFQPIFDLTTGLPAGWSASAASRVRPSARRMSGSRKPRPANWGLHSRSRPCARRFRNHATFRAGFMCRSMRRPSL